MIGDLLRLEIMAYTTSQKHIYGGVFFLFISIVLAHYFGWISPLERVLYQLFVPVSSESYKIGIKIENDYQFFKNKQEFFDRYAQCASDLSRAQINLAAIQQLTEENNQLKKQLHYIENGKTPTILAEVAGREIAGAEKTILIRAGFSSGIKVGQPVISDDGIMVGTVVKTENSVSLVRLISDLGSKIEISTLHEQKSIGILEGGFGITLKMKFVPRNEVVKVDDLVVTSGYQPMVPRGLVVGKVIEVLNEANQGFQDISVVPLVDLNKLLQVSVILTQ